MKITVLVDDIEGSCEAEHGLSFFIEDEINILFDSGPSDILIRNAVEIGLDLKDIDIIVLSHGHWDHGNGLKYLEGKKLVCHPDCFIRRFRSSDMEEIGLPFKLDEAKERFDVILSKGPYKLTKRIIFLGEIERKNDFESKKTSYITSDERLDFVPDDTALVFDTEKGLIIVTGCSHSGICNIIEHAKKVMVKDEIYAVVGGMHLKDEDMITKKTIEYLKRQEIGMLIPTHCTSQAVIAKMDKSLNVARLRSGDIIEI